MAKGTGTYDDPIICDGIFSKTIDGVKKFFKLNGNSSADHVATSIGQIAWFAQAEVPNGYLVCNGANVSRTTYADLFNAIGITFGSGDGSTTFALPNLIDRFAQGSTTVGTYKSAGLPNITGKVGYISAHDYKNDDPNIFSNQAIDWAEYKQASTTLNGDGSHYIASDLKIDASKSNGIYGKSSTVQPPALTLLPCIRY